MTDEGEEKPTPKLSVVPKNSLYVRNLSPEITEIILRGIFGEFDEIEKVTFRAYPNSNNQFFAQIDFASSKGVTEGSKLSGVSILGTPCEAGVVDPTITAHQRHVGVEVAGSGVQSGSAPDNFDGVNARIAEAAEDQRMRTVHVAGLAPGTTGRQLERLCMQFGEVERLRVDTDTDGATFGLVEFKDQGPAHVAKTQHKFLVDQKVIAVTEARSMVDEAEFIENTIQFQAPVLDAMSMENILTQQTDLKAKLENVRKVAMLLSKKQENEMPDKDAEPDSEGPLAAVSRRLAEKKERKKGKKMEKKLKKQQKKLKKKLKKKMKKLKKLKQEDEEEESVVESVCESSEGPVKLDDDEIELVDNSELVMLSESSSDDSSDTPDPPPKRRRLAFTKLSSIISEWQTNTEHKDAWVLQEGGSLMFNGRKLKSDRWGFVESGGGAGLSIYCRGQRRAGWELDLRASTINQMVWKKDGETDITWSRQQLSAVNEKADEAKQQTSCKAVGPNDRIKTLPSSKNAAAPKASVEEDVDDLVEVLTVIPVKKRQKNGKI